MLPASLHCSTYMDRYSKILSTARPLVRLARSQERTGSYCGLLSNEHTVCVCVCSLGIDSSPLSLLDADNGAQRAHCARLVAGKTHTHTYTSVHTLADTLMCVCVCVCGPLFVVAVDFSSLAAAAHTMLDKLISNNLILLSISDPCTALRHIAGGMWGRGGW